MKRMLMLAAACCILAGAARADIVHLKNGSKFEGKVVREGDTVLIIRGRSKMRIPADQVARIEKAPTPDELYAGKLEELDADDPDGWLALAAWCRKKSLAARERECLERVVELDPGNRPAHEGLGHVRHDGKWMTREEAMKARGFRKVDGRWLSPEEYAAVQSRIAREEAMKARIAEFAGTIQKLASSDDAESRDARSKIRTRKAAYLPYLAYYARRGKPGALRLECLKLIDEFGYTDPAYSNLIAHLAHRDDFTKMGDYARGMIKRRKDDMALLYLVKVAAAGDLTNRRRACIAIRKIGDRRAVGALIQCLAVQVAGKASGPLSLDSVLNMQPGVGSPGRMTIGGGVIVPAADSLEFITGKEFKNDVNAWLNWYNAAGGGT